jgi:hypothetical protein
LVDGADMLGVIGEPLICKNGRNITAWGGWRAYMQHAEPPDDVTSSGGASGR